MLQRMRAGRTSEIFQKVIRAAKGENEGVMEYSGALEVKDIYLSGLLSSALVSLEERADKTGSV